MIKEDNTIELLPGSTIRDAVFDGIIHSYDNNLETLIANEYHWYVKINLQANRSEDSISNAMDIKIKFYAEKEEEVVKIERIIDSLKKWVEAEEVYSSDNDYPNIDYICNILEFHKIDISYEGLYSDHIEDKEI